MNTDNLNSFVEGCQKLVNEQYKDSPLPIPQLTISMGKRYAKIVRDDTVQRSVYCFVDPVTGDVLKAAGWAKPAKGARGNINNPDNGLSRMSAYGAAYNK